MRLELVSVVIPAFNAEATLARTLASVQAQTYANIEIWVVDDGSTDGTRQLAEAAARADARIRVLSKPNGGVAEARNAGIRASAGTLVAPLDADDLWHPEKIAKQVAVLAEGGPTMGFVYTYYRRIDANDNLLSMPTVASDFEGHVFLRHLLFNFVGNGSSLLMRRAAFEAAGGYEPDLQRQGAQGCEDYLLQLLIARFWTVGVVREYLTGYRSTAGAMSAERDRMNRSLLLMLEHVRRRVPETPTDVLAVAEAALRGRRAMGMLFHKRRPITAAQQYLRALGCAPAPAQVIAGPLFRQSVSSFVKRHLTRTRPPVGRRYPFLTLNPAIGSAPIQNHPLHKWLVAFAEREESFFLGGSAGSGGATIRRKAFSPDLETRMVPVVASRQSVNRQ